MDKSSKNGAISAISQFSLKKPEGYAATRWKKTFTSHGTPNLSLFRSVGQRLPQRQVCWRLVLITALVMVQRLPASAAGERMRKPFPAWWFHPDAKVIWDQKISEIWFKRTNNLKPPASFCGWRRWVYAIYLSFTQSCDSNQWHHQNSRWDAVDLFIVLEKVSTLAVKTSLQGSQGELIHIIPDPYLSVWMCMD